MQIMIDIPDEYKKQFDENRCKEKFDSLATNEFGYILRKAFENGTPLPKGHGRLIDADEYKEHLYACETNGRPLHIMELDERLATIDNVPTIIEAESEVTT